MDLKKITYYESERVKLKHPCEYDLYRFLLQLSITFLILIVFIFQLTYNSVLIPYSVICGLFTVFYQPELIKANKGTVSTLKSLRSKRMIQSDRIQLTHFRLLIYIFYHHKFNFLFEKRKKRKMND